MKFSACRVYISDKDAMDRNVHNLEVLHDLAKEHGGDAHMNDMWKRSESSNMHMIQYRRLKKDDCTDTDVTRSDTYTLNEAIAYTEKQLSFYQEKVSKAAPTLDDACITTITYKFPEEIENDALPWYQRKKWREDMYFMKSLQQYGAEHFVTWMCQSILNETLMRHILIHNLHKDSEVRPSHTNNISDEIMKRILF